MFGNKKFNKCGHKRSTVIALDSQSAAPFVLASPFYTKRTTLCLPVPQALYEIMNELLKLLEAAENEIANIKWEEHHPDYPDAINTLMQALGKSDLMFKDYRKHNFKDAIENIQTANLEQLKCVVTSIVRSERWATGSWKTHLEKNYLQSAIKQAVKLTNENV